MFFNISDLMSNLNFNSVKLLYSSERRLCFYVLKLEEKIF